MSVSDPYPDPVSYKYASVISPVIKGVIVNVPPVVFAYETFTSTSIGGYWKIWYPPRGLRASVPNPVILTNFFLSTFSVPDTASGAGTVP